MNFKRYLGATVALFIFIFLYEWLVNGVFLTDWYHETPNVWREPEEMMANMPLLLGIQFIFAAWCAFIFATLFPEGGIKNGLLLGLFFGVFAGILMAEWYLWLPVEPKLGWSWLACGIGEGLGSGLILGSIYRR
jgi:MFS family permease